MTAASPPSARPVVVVGAGPAGMTTALLLARAGHRVVLLERDGGLGGLWATRADADGRYISENSCKVYQGSYHTAPALFALIGQRWQDHFVPRHDLTMDWLRPFVAACTPLDLARLTGAFALHAAGARDYRTVSVAEWLNTQALSEPCQAWMRATALGGITGTLRMSMWELFHRLGTNVVSMFSGTGGALYWNARPPDAAGGFVRAWEAALRSAGVEIRTGCAVTAVEAGPTVVLADGSVLDATAVFLAVPPRALARLLANSAPAVQAAFRRGPDSLEAVLDASLYEHLGITWTFASALPRPLPLGGHNVRSGWHPILVEHAQYRAHLAPPAVTAVVGSVSVATDLRHPRLGTRARDHEPEELAQILWDDERRVDPTLPVPIGSSIYGLSDATQIVHHGPLPQQAAGLPVYLSTNIAGAAPYFTASLESAIQAGAAAALAFDPSVERLPTGGRRATWRAQTTHGRSGTVPAVT